MRMTYEYKCELIRVVDGDTIKISVSLGFSVWLRNETLRLNGIDTCESRINLKRFPKRTSEKERGLAAKARLKELLPKQFIIKTMKKSTGKFGRILAVPIVDGVDICQQLIDEGHARPYFGGTKEPWV